MLAAPDASTFLSALDARGKPLCPGRRIAVVVAHPDDETIGAGGQLARLDRPLIVHVTDGAPRDGADAGLAGFGCWRDYAAARRHELEAAVALAGVTAGRLLDLEVPDQGAVEAVPAIAAALACIFGMHGIELVLTHPYEGGHVDHDATALAVHAAAALLRRKRRPPPAIVEMAFYHERADGLMLQRFPPGPSAGERAVMLDPESRSLKRRMMAAHASQARVLAPFAADVERFRPAPAYDFGSPANGGRVHYPSITPGMTAERWCGIARESLAALGLPERMADVALA